MLFFVPLLCYTGLRAARRLKQAPAAKREEGGKREKKLKYTVKSVCAVTSAEPSNELVALPPVTEPGDESLE